MLEEEYKQFLYNIKTNLFNLNKMLFMGTQTSDKAKQVIEDFINKNKEKPRYIFRRLLFRTFGDAVNFWIRCNLGSINDIQKVSKNRIIEWLCGFREKGVKLQEPWELDYFCPICSKPIYSIEEIDTIDGFLEASKLRWSEYRFHVWCENCNVDIPEFLCLKTDSKEALEIYRKRFLDMIREIRQEEMEYY